MGVSVAEGAVPVTGMGAYDGENIRHILQWERAVFMQFFIPGQSYS